MFLKFYWYEFNISIQLPLHLLFLHLFLQRICNILYTMHQYVSFVLNVCNSTSLVYCWMCTNIEHVECNSFSIILSLLQYKLSINVKPVIWVEYVAMKWRKKSKTPQKFQKPIRKPVKRNKIDTPYHTNTWPRTFLAWYRHDNKKWQGYVNFKESKPSLLLKWCGQVNVFRVWVKCQPHI